MICTIFVDTKPRIPIFLVYRHSLKNTELWRLQNGSSNIPWGGLLPKMIQSPEIGGSNIQPHPPGKSHVHNLWWAQYEKEGQREKGARRLARETEIKLRLRVIWKKDCLFSRCYGTARLNLFWTWIILTSPTAPYGLPLPCLNSRLLDCTAAWTPRFTEGDRGGFRRLTSGYIHWTKMKSANSSHIVT